MSKVRFAERQDDARRAVSRLSEGVAQPETEMVRDAVIQRFEFTFEVVWKTLKLYLEAQGHACSSPRATIKAAFEEGIIPSPEAADIWLRMLNDRNMTSQAYLERLALRIYKSIVGEYAALLVDMGGRIAKLEWN